MKSVAVLTALCLAVAASPASVPSASPFLLKSTIVDSFLQKGATETELNQLFPDDQEAVYEAQLDEEKVEETIDYYQAFPETASGVFNELNDKMVSDKLLDRIYYAEPESVNKYNRLRNKMART